MQERIWNVIRKTIDVAVDLFVALTIIMTAAGIIVRVFGH